MDQRTEQYGTVQIYVCFSFWIINGERLRSKQPLMAYSSRIATSAQYTFYPVTPSRSIIIGYPKNPLYPRPFIIFNNQPSLYLPMYCMYLYSLVFFFLLPLENGSLFVYGCRFIRTNGAGILSLVPICWRIKFIVDSYIFVGFGFFFHFFTLHWMPIFFFVYSYLICFIFADM